MTAHRIQDIFNLQSCILLCCIAALLGRFLPRLGSRSTCGPLSKDSRPTTIVAVKAAVTLARGSVGSLHLHASVEGLLVGKLRRHGQASNNRHSPGGRIGGDGDLNVRPCRSKKACTCDAWLRPTCPEPHALAQFRRPMDMTHSAPAP